MVPVAAGTDDGSPAAIRWIKLEGLEGNRSSSIAFGTARHHHHLLFSRFRLPLLKPKSEPWHVSCCSLASITSAILGGHGLTVRQKDSSSRPPVASVSSSLKPVTFSPIRGTYAYEVLLHRFKEMDIDDNGLISEGELKIALKRLNLPASEKDIEDFVYRIGGKKQVTFEQFAEFAIQRENELVDTFKDLDKHKTGYISMNGMKAAIKKYRFRNAERDIGEVSKGFLKSPAAYKKGHVLDFAEFRELLMMSSIRDLRDPLETWGRAIVDLGDVDTTFPLSSGQCLHLGPSTKHKSKKKALMHLFASSISAGVSRTVVSPLERVKVMSMVRPDVAKDGFASMFPKLWRQEGIQCLFRGNLLNVLRIAPTKIVEYLIYNNVKELRWKSTDRFDINSVESMLLGAAASMAGMFLSHPIDTVRTSFLVQHPDALRRPLDCTKDIIKAHGFGGLYRGIIPSMMRVIPYAAVNFTVYDELEKWYRRKYGPGGELGLLPSISFGVLGGATAQILVYPFETLQRRLQAQAYLSSGVTYKNMIDALHILIKEEGILALYAGLVPNLLKLAPAAASSLLVYGAISKTLENRQQLVNDK